MSGSSMGKIIITKLPSQWPLKGFRRFDIDGYVLLSHPERSIVFSEDGKSWQELNNQCLKKERDLMIKVENRIFIGGLK